MLDIVSYSPAYLSFILTLLIWKGLKAKHAYRILWKDLIIVPIALLIWTIYSIIKNYELIFILPWALSACIGTWLGLVIGHKSSHRFNEKKKVIEFPGSWVPMTLLLFIFSLRIFIGAIWGVHPELKGNIKLFIIENLETIISAMFLVKLIRSKKHSKRFSH